MSGASFLGTLPLLAGGGGRAHGGLAATAWLACTPLPRSGQGERGPPIPRRGLGRDESNRRRRARPVLRSGGGNGSPCRPPPPPVRPATTAGEPRGGDRIGHRPSGISGAVLSAGK